MEVKQKKKKKKMSKGGLVLLIGCIIILIPCLIFGGILLSASLQTGKPVVGSRFDNDLQPTISEGNIETLTNSIKNINGVDDCNVILKSAQLRVNVKCTSSLDSAAIESLCVDVYNAVNNTLPISSYFTASSSMKMYDLAINVYNMIDSENDNMIYYILTKNSQMSEYSIQCVSEPVDEELAKELRGETQLETGTGDVQVEGEDVENPGEE